ncbi:MAG TPA: MauE/DoxX family redox-associated membrane protein [Thermomicrobiales bacterium]|jgi:peroxiredoxin|nr:MauE/DoxX family redox-associated membrane protein [Thermomicrobiales bacterium]
MDVLLLMARLVLTAVFLVAGVAKLADLAGSRQALRDFGVPARMSGPLGVALPLGELAVAALLLPTVTAWWGALGALALLLAFIGGIAVSLTRGRRPDCHCFGQLHSSPAGWPTLARNGALAAVAAGVLWQGPDGAGASVVAWADNLTAAEGVAVGIASLALVLAAAGGWVLAHLVSQNGRLLHRLDALEAAGAGGAPSDAGASASPPPGLAVGTTAPSFSLPGLHGETVTLDALRATGKSVLLLFSDPTCGPCTSLLPDVSRWQHQHAGAMTIALLSSGGPEANRAKGTEYGLTQVLLQQDREVAQAYGAQGTPAAVLVRPDGAIGSPLALGTDAIRSLIAQVTGGGTPAPIIPLRPLSGPGGARHGTPNGHNAPSRPEPLQVGEAAPALRLPDLDGHEIDLQSYRGERVLLLFWDPGCGFCARMLDSLRAWEAIAPPDAPRVLVVSSGSVQANRDLGLRSTVVLDQGFGVGRSFGADGTPSSVLIDEEGRIASGPAAGAQAVLRQAGALSRTA